DPSTQSESQIPRPGERLRHSLKSLGIRLSKVGCGAFRTGGTPGGGGRSAELMDATLSARAAPWREYCRVHDRVAKMVAPRDPCRRFLAIPGVGQVTALSRMTAIDDPTR